MQEEDTPPTRLGYLRLYFGIIRSHGGSRGKVSFIAGEGRGERAVKLSSVKLFGPCLIYEFVVVERVTDLMVEV